MGQSRFGIWIVQSCLLLFTCDYSIQCGGNKDCLSARQDQELSIILCEVRRAKRWRVRELEVCGLWR
jgi:hypothetical protein